VIDVDYVIMWQDFSDEEYLDRWVRITALIEKDEIRRGLGGETSGFSRIRPVNENESRLLSGAYVTIVGKVTREKVTSDNLSTEIDVIFLNHAIVQEATAGEISIMESREQARNED